MHVQKMNKNYVNTKIKQKLEKTNLNNTKAQEKGDNLLAMGKQLELSDKAFQMDGKMPLSQAIPLGLQHVLAMFVGNLTPLLIITGACGIAGGDFADLQLALLQNAMLLAGIVPAALVAIILNIVLPKEKEVGKS